MTTADLPPSASSSPADTPESPAIQPTQSSSSQVSAGQDQPNPHSQPQQTQERQIQERQIQERQIQVCQNRTCLRSQSDKVLASLQAEAPANVIVLGSGCLGQCGAGPIVRVDPDNIWYCRVATKTDVLEIVAQHLNQDQPVRRLLHPRIHAYYPPASPS
ncbi:MAG: (2Fe-2S) ferredoxin domain-containing protein [Cyanobacteria bacterium J06632_22]